MSAPYDSPTPSDRRAAWIAACLLALVAGFYLLRGMPWASEDDLVFIGAGIDLARTGRLINHTMNGWLAEFGTDKFYVQLPLYPWSLACWIRLFGAGTASFSVFEWIWYAVGGSGLIRLLGRFGLPLGLRLLMAAMYLTLLIPYGLRPDAEAFAWTFLGLGLWDADSPSWQKFTALLMLGFGTLTYPLTLAFAAPFTGALLWLQRTRGLSATTQMRDTVRRWLPPLGIAVALVLALFLAMIRFDLGSFAAVFEAHRRSRILQDGTLGGTIRLVVEYEGKLLVLPMYLLLLGCMAFVAARWRHVEPRLRALVCVCAAAAASCTLLYAARAPVWVMLLAYLAGCAVALGYDRFQPLRWTLLIALTGMYTGSQCLWIVTACTRRFPDAAVLGAARETALRSGKALVVDSSAARYVFDYQLPERTRDFVFFKPFQRQHPMTLADKKGDACWIVSAYVFDHFSEGLPPLYRSYPRATIGHHLFHSVPLCPDNPVVIP